jgi:starch-binding outer membrane protein, SusD/RagB family
MKCSFFCLWYVVALCSCKKMIEVPAPATSLSGVSVYSANPTAIGVLTGIYENMSASGLATAGSIPSLSLFTGLSGDELTLWSGSYNFLAEAYYGNALSGSVGLYGSEYWSGLYPVIASCNAAIAGLGASARLTPAVKQQLLGEAYFLRAFHYFYLVNLFGDVAMPLSVDYPADAGLPRSPADTVYRQIVADLRFAEGLLSAQWLDATLMAPGIDRVRPTKWAAQALLARVYLYTGDWADAVQEADSVIGNTALFTLVPLNEVFLKSSLGNNEAIWQLQAVDSGWDTQDALAFIIPAAGPGAGASAGVYLSDELLGSFESQDMRRSNWVDSVIVGADIYFFPFKYKVASYGQPVTEYLTVFRLAELYLVRAEAKARLGDLAGAGEDLDLIRARAGLGPVNADSDLLSAIWHERQVELFSELGQRWLDLKRVGRVDSVMGPVTPLKGGGAWQPYEQWYPLPVSDLQLDPNLVQNQGY